MADKPDHELSALIRAHATRHRANAGLESAVRTEIALQSAAKRQPEAGRRWSWPSWSLVGVGFAFGVMMSASIMLVSDHSSDKDRLEKEVIGNHVRALMANHLTDVASTNQHTVKPWFQGKLTYSPPIQDLELEGFPLVGGRLDYISGQPVAALIYRRNNHFINIFVWPTTSEDGVRRSSQQGYNVIHWAHNGMRYFAVSDLNADELNTLAKFLH